MITLKNPPELTLLTVSTYLYTVWGCVTAATARASDAVLTIDASSNSSSRCGRLARLGLVCQLRLVFSLTLLLPRQYICMYRPVPYQSGYLLQSTDCSAPTAL